MKKSKVVHINLMGGLIGLLATNPRRALEQKIDQENRDGWNAIYFQAHRDTNLLGIILKFIVLVCTLFLFTWGAGYMVLFERETDE